MNRCVIVGGADISHYDRARAALLPTDFLIYCDCGLRHQTGLRRTPNLIVGDFDSYDNPHLAIETIVLPSVKDDTDTVFAVKEAVRRGFTDFLLLGAVGGRLDHTLGNVSILLMLDAKGFFGNILDDWSNIEVVSSRRNTVEIDDSCSFFSLLAIDGPAEGICVENAKYPLQDAKIDANYPYGVSNEVLSGQTARVSVGQGRLLLVRVF